MIQRVNRRLAGQYSASMTHDEAMVHFQTRATMIRCANRIFVEAGIPQVTHEEIEGARIIEREIGGAA
jgi:hypothetical protein